MSFPGTPEKQGVITGQHHDRKWTVPVRDVPRIGRQIGRDEYGNYIYDDDSIGDLIGFTLWKKSTRENSAWMHAWPVRLAAGAVGGDPQGPPGTPTPGHVGGSPGASLASVGSGAADGQVAISDAGQDAAMEVNDPVGNTEAAGEGQQEEGGG